MKRIVVFFVVFLTIFMTVYAYASLSTVELQFKTIENVDNEDFDLYVLLPEKYIKFAMLNSYLDIKYEGIKTLKNNVIPGISINIDNIQEETQTENGVEYVQVLLDKNEDDIYTFEMLKDYNDLDIKFRIKNDKKDYIVHIDNFKIENGVCKIEYNYSEDIVKQPDKIMINGAMILVIILIIVIILGVISYIKNRV